MIEILYEDEKAIVCIKPRGVLSTDEAGGLPELLRAQLAAETVKTVHRLDRVVGGVMVLARTKAAAATLTEQISEGSFLKEYLAVVHGAPDGESGTLCDLLRRDAARRMTFVCDTPSKDARPALLDYRVLGRSGELSLIQISLHTGRTHQIRVQFASRNMPLVGERKYSSVSDGCGIALWSHKIVFFHPKTGERMSFTAPPPMEFPWNVFEIK